MFDLRLTPEQLEFRDTVRSFVQNEVKPAALRADRLEPFEKPLLSDLVDEASRMGLRALCLPEAAGGAEADTLTSCIVMEELAVGDVDIAVVLSTTAQIARALFGGRMTDAQTNRFLPRFLEDRGHHLAIAAHDDDAGRGWHYHRPYDAGSGARLRAIRQSDGDWIIDGDAAAVANAPIAKLFAVQAKTGSSGIATFLVPSETGGLQVDEAACAVNERAIRWHHGTSAGVRFKICRVPSELVLGKEDDGPLANEGYSARAAVHLAAINLGVGRAAYEAAVDYAGIRVQGGRPIVQHQSIGTLLADSAIKLEAARNLVWKAAWASDHAEGLAGGSPTDLPLHVVARSFTAEAMHEVTLAAAECFGAMGVMRDMPMQKYVHDALVLLHSADNDSATKLQIAEAIAGYRRPVAA